MVVEAEANHTAEMYKQNLAPRGCATNLGVFALGSQADIRVALSLSWFSHPTQRARIVLTVTRIL
jgi:hypothetical protein